MSDNYDSFCQKLDEHHDWPCPYMFKFIVPSANLGQLTELFSEFEFQLRESKNGKFTSVTIEHTMTSSQEVVKIYEKAAVVPGLMSL